jgi:uncharacterized protein
VIRTFAEKVEQRLIGAPQFLQVVLGARQVGKTTGMLALHTRLEDESCFVTADDAVAPSVEWLVEQWNKARLQAGCRLLIVDEVQLVPGWSSVVKRLWDEDRRNGRELHVVVLGSSSLDLHLGLTESLAGRFELHQVPHWSYKECKEAFHWSFDTFLEYGGYPGPASLLPDIPRWESYIKHSIIEPVVTRDILASQRITKPALLRQTFEFLMEYPAQVISYQKMLGQLQDRGNAATIKHYCTLLEQAFLILLVQKFSTRPATTRGSSPKIVPLAPALIRGVTRRSCEDASWRGRVVENCVIAHLHTSGLMPYYWSEGSAEVDVVIKFPDCVVAVELKSGTNKKVSGLKSFLKAFPNAKPVILGGGLIEKLLLDENPEGFLRVAAGVG